MKIATFCACASLIAIGGIAALPGEPPGGRELFTRRCSGCHALDINKEGPRLRGIIGRRAGSMADFPYSGALRGSRIVWTEELLGKWLEYPDRLVEGTDMDFQVPDAAERASIISWLKSM